MKFKLPLIKSVKPIVPTKDESASKIAMVEKGMVSLVDVISPSSVEVDFRYIRVGERYYSTFFIIGYPRFVSPNWLQPLIDYDHTLDISLFVYPASSADVLTDLRRKIGEMEATIAGEQEEGRVVDPKVEAALEDAQALQEELAKGVERFFQFSFYITLSSDELNELQQAAKQLQTTLASMLLTAKVATLQMEEGFKSTLPIAQDRLYITRNMDTTSLASTFPFSSAILTQDKGVMYGVNLQNGSLIIFDRFSLENANEIVLGKSGSGKSYLIKLEIMRQYMLGTEVVVVDPEGEYEKLSETLGGNVVEFSASSPIKINPFDLSELYEEGENELGLKILSLHGLLKIIMGELDPAHDSILDKALIETYRQKGITPDPQTQKKDPPLMEDLYKTLLGMEDPLAKEMALRLERFIKGSASGIFNQKSNFDITSPLTIFSIRNLEEELRPIAMHIILDFVWTRVKKSLKKRLLVLDEAWYMMQYEDSASFVYSIAKRARKYYLGLTTATQDVEDFLKTEYGKAVLTNSSIQILLKQGTAEVDLAQKIFYLSEGERELLISADIGEGLFFAGQNHVAVKVLAAPFEHELITSDPAELMRRQQAEAAIKLQETAQQPPQHEETVSELASTTEIPTQEDKSKGEPSQSNTSAPNENLHQETNNPTIQSSNESQEKQITMARPTEQSVSLTEAHPVENSSPETTTSPNINDIPLEKPVREPELAENKQEEPDSQSSNLSTTNDSPVLIAVHNPYADHAPHSVTDTRPVIPEEASEQPSPQEDQRDEIISSDPQNNTTDTSEASTPENKPSPFASTQSPSPTPVATTPSEKTTSEEKSASKIISPFAS